MVMFQLFTSERAGVITGRQDLADRWSAAGRRVGTVCCLTSTVDAVVTCDEPAGETERWVFAQLGGVS